MFSRMRNFVSRHKKKFIVTGLVIGGGAIAIKYAAKKLIEFQEAKAKEFIESTKRIQHFEATEKTCNQAIQSLHSNLMDAILKLYDIDSDLNELRTEGATLKPQQKIDLWNRILLKSFTRLITLVYASILFVITMRVQLNILGGYMYKEIDSDDKVLSKDIQNRYLSMIQTFFSDGISELAQIVQGQTEKMLSKYDLKQKLNLSDVEHIFESIQFGVNEVLDVNKRSKLAKMVLQAEESHIEHEHLQKMMIETVDLLETEELFLILTQHVGNVFSLTTDELANHFTLNKTLNNHKNKDSAVGVENPSFNISEIKIPLAKIIPIINGLIPKTINGRSLSSDILRVLINSDKIKMLGANVYEVFSQ